MSHTAKIKGRAEDTLEYVAYDSRQPDMEKYLDCAYERVLKPAFEEIGSPIESKATFLSLAHVGEVNPDAVTHLVIVYKNGEAIGASIGLGYGRQRTGFWIYDGVAPEARGNGIATAMHRALEEAMRKQLGSGKFRMFLEVSHPVREALYEKYANLGYRPLEMEYRDAFGAPDWTLLVGDILPGGLKYIPHEGVAKHELMTLLEQNIDIAQVEQRKTDPDKADSQHAELMAFYRESLAHIPGETVPVLSYPSRFRDVIDGKKQPYQWRGGCPDGL